LSSAVGFCTRAAAARITFRYNWTSLSVSGSSLCSVSGGIPVEVGVVGPAVCAIGGGWFLLHPATVNVVSNASAARRPSAAPREELNPFFNIYFSRRAKIIGAQQRMRQSKPSAESPLWKT
jgi:hypothetical protein